ncbi:undecaprenyl-diphosphate phosphatase [Parvibacter caecicola]|uniref:Undecaprenyl-diphosphatase n=1 Tax=Parvibacter caecicola TaxID=747645 RepID=A0A3N0ACT5_9ACTN|nr:undecaprenyl-diphosphate phosphatase [Parvibacter caecicola]MBB3171421.1 undecaprenyl-diphosphatase [Parvibacter caecicola]MCR2042242.1 undecaprenyl-diphosphate phosphatase [Parvibacter caecicola]RNL11201.1 undecaprenyl-diphosphate phosphatase [Parvibacter caecicola]TJW09881.1 undecaprenyl-diphosphate phosphatase [Parvibacter caecicola]
MITEILKALVIGIVEGITEWLPVSSTGHMILVDEFVKLAVSPEFLELFLVVIQIGAICAVLILYFHKLNPFSPRKTPAQKRSTWRLWGMVVIGCIPAAIIGFTLDDFFNEHFYNAWTVAIALIVYGVVFIVLEHHNRKREAAYLAGRNARSGRAQRPRGRHARPEVQPAAAQSSRLVRNTASYYNDPSISGRLPKTQLRETALGHEEPRPGFDGDDAERALFKVQTVDDIDWKTALKIGCFQMLAIIPGTSRSGSTIIGGMLCGCSRTAAAEFTFFLAIPVMFGWGLLKTVKYIAELGLAMTGTEVAVLVTGILTAFVVSVVSIKFLMGYIKKNDFTAFGVYRIVVGVVVLAYFGAKAVGVL